MAGLFGGAAAQYDPAQLSPSDKLMMVGAMLKDVGSGLRGGESDAVMQARNFLAQRQMFERMQGLMGGLIGGQAQYQDGPAPQVQAPPVTTQGAQGAPPSMGDMGPPPETTPTNYTYQPPQQIPGTGPVTSIADPRAAKFALMAPMMGLNPQPYIDVLKANQPQFDSARPGAAIVNKLTGQITGRVSNPQYINDQLVDPTSSNAPAFVPKYETGTMPDGRGGVIPMAGAIAAAQEKARADALGRTLGGVQTVTRPDGKTVTDLGSRLFGGDGSGAPSPGGPTRPVGGFVAPSPQDAEYRKTLANAAAERYKAYQDAGAAAPGAISRIQAMRSLLQGVEGGHYAPELYDIASGLNSLGIKVDSKLPNKDAATVLERSMASEAMKNPDTGANMFPRVTNFEYENALKQIPGLMQSAKGRDIVVAMKTAEQNRIADIATRARAWNQQFGRIDAPDSSGKTFQDYLNAWSAKHPLYAGIPGMTPK